MSIQTIRLSALALAATMVAACYQVPQSTAASGQAGEIFASDQAAGSVIVVDKIGMPSTGWLVVHAVQNGEPDLSGAIGHAYVSAGPSSNLSVPLTTALPAGSEAVVMLHLDTGNAKVFEFANGAVEVLDGPVLRDGKPVMQKIALR